MIFKDDNNAPLFKFTVEGGLLKYSFWNGSGWDPSQSITDPAVDPGDSTMLPFNMANTRIVIENGLFSVYLDGILKMQLSASTLWNQLNNINIDNQVSDVAVRFKTLLGQKLVIKDADSNNDLFTLNAT